MDTMNWVARVLEFFGGLLLILGLFTRQVAFLLSGKMVVAYSLVQAPQGFFSVEGVMNSSSDAVASRHGESTTVS
jgi:putative oxidoreductase